MIAKVQEVEQDNASGHASESVTVAATGSGNALVLAVWQAAGSTALTFTVSDNVDGTTGWNVPSAIASAGPPPADETSGANSSVALAYKLNCPSGITTLTVTWSAAGKTNSVNATEWSGVGSATDGSANGGGSVAGTSHPTPSVTTTNAADLVIAAIEVPTSPVTFTGDAGWTELSQGAQGGNRGAAAYNITSASGSYSASWTTSTSVKWGAVTLAFKGSTGTVTTVKNLAALGVG